MPELPEVESTRRGLETLVLGKTIEKVDVLWPRMIVTALPMAEWSQLLAGQQIEAVNRRGKYLVFKLTDWALISHLRMEGKYIHYPASSTVEQKDKHTHVIFTFTDESSLHYRDVRKFGRFELIQPEHLETYFEKKKIGPEPMRDSFDLTEFKHRLIKTSRAIKTALLSQEYVAGLGNIYVDEVLFLARIHPATKASDLQADQIEQIYEAILDVIERAIRAGGSSVRTYRNSLGEAGEFQEQLAVYGRTDEPCVNCGTPINKIKLAQRGTHYCPNCQPLL